MGFGILSPRDEQAAAKRPTRAPLSIYVMWHPQFADGAVLARDLADWFWGGSVDLRMTGVGIPVHFRSAAWRDEYELEREAALPRVALPPGPVGEREQWRNTWRRPIRLDDAQHNVFIPIVDDNMVDDPSWRRDLLELAQHHHAVRNSRSGELDAAKANAGPCVHLAPIQVTAAWPRMPELLTRVKAFYLRRWDDTGGDDERVPRWCVRLRRLVTQALVRLLNQLRDSTLPTEVFLSHAKADLSLGPGVAEQLRDVAAGYGQIEVFYDENDLPSGTNWKHRMLDAAGGGAGLIAVLSDRYATRFWCRREIQAARTLERGSNDPTSPLYDVWSVRPTVVAVTMEKDWSRLVGDLGTAPAIRWRQGDHAHAPAILDQLFREALIGEFQRHYAEVLHHTLRAQVAGLPARPQVAFVTWTPDPASLLRLRKRLEREGWKGRGLLVYPGHGFMPTEVDDLVGSLGPEVAIVSFAELADRLAPDSNPTWESLTKVDREPRPSPRWKMMPIIALSAGDADDLAVLGYDQPADEGISRHVDQAVLRVCRTLLEHHVRIAYGGTIRDDSPNFTSMLNDVVAAVSTDSPGADPSDPDAGADPATPLENWIPRPRAATYTAERRAIMAGLCRFYFVGDAEDAMTPRQVSAARSLSAMRAQVAENTIATVSFAGKRWRFNGIMPGIAEELLCAMEASGGAGPELWRVSMLLIGEYGGATREMVRYIVGATAELPAALTYEGQWTSGSYLLAADLQGDSALVDHVRERYARLAECLGHLRAVATRKDRALDEELPKLGLTIREWKAIMTTGSIGYVRRLVQMKVVPRLHQLRSAGSSRRSPG